MSRVLAAAVCAAALTFVAAPAQAAIVLDGSSGVAPTPVVSPIPGVFGQGALLFSQTVSGTALTFAATFNAAVYRSVAGTLDFYFQVLRNGPGSQLDRFGKLKDQEIKSFTVSDFTSYIVDGFASAGDPDGAGVFVAANNPQLANGTPSTSTTTFGRSVDGDVLRVDFGLNGLSGTENSATYIFRTNATTFDRNGNFGIIDGSTINGSTFQPTGAPVPEPGTWALMLLGFAGVGMALRRRPQVTRRVNFAMA